MHCHHTPPITTHTTEMHATTQMMCRQQTPHALPPHTNHHRYSTMTQPCHKDTPLNQQCCDSEHTEEAGGKKRTTRHTPHATRHTHPAIHNTRRHASSHIAPCHHTQDRRGTRQREGDKTMRRGGSNPNTGHHNTHHSRHSTRPPHKRDGGHQHTDGGHQHSREVNHTAALPLLCHPPPQRHPPPTIAPPTTTTRGRADRGYPTTRTPQTDSHLHHTTHLAMEQYAT